MMKRSELAKHEGEEQIRNYSVMALQDGVETRAGTYVFDEGDSGGEGGSGRCPPGYIESSCPICIDEVIVVACPDCGATNGCWCPWCFYCGEQEKNCRCTRCPRCKNKMPECTCYLYPDPGTGGGSTNPGTGSGGGTVTPPAGGGGTQGQTGGKVSAIKITSAAEKAAKAALTKFGLSLPACNFEVRISATTNIIIFLGQHSGTDLSKLIIFAVTRDEIKLVYNQKAQINSITKTSDNISMIVQSNIPEENDVPITHTIWSANGVLKFKDN